MRAEDAVLLIDSYLRLAGRGACLHRRPDVPADLVWIEWPCWDGGAVHALARRSRGHWRTTLLRTPRDAGPSDVVDRLRSLPGATLAAIVERPDDQRARIVLGAACGEISGLIELALSGSGIAVDDRAVREAAAVHARVVAPAMAAAHGEGVLRAFRDFAEGRIGLDAVDLLTDTGRRGDGIRALALTHPLVARLALSSTLSSRALRAGDDLHAALALPCPGYTPAHLRGAAGAGWDAIAAMTPAGEGVVPTEREVLRQARHAMRLAASLPPDWMPRGAAAWTAFATVSCMLSSTSVVDARHLGRSKGDWVALTGRLARIVGMGGEHPRRVAAVLAGAAEDLMDVQQSFLKQVVLPICGNAMHRLSYPSFGVEADESDIPIERAMPSAGTLLWGGKDIGACLELSRRWHARRDGIDRVVVDVEPGVSWAAACAPFRHGTAEVRSIVDAIGLWEEGSSVPDRDGLAGLDHCVYGRLRLFREGYQHVFSVRDGTGARMSTLQVRFDGGKPFQVEHRGLGNVDPPPGACEAVAAFLAALASGALGDLPRAPNPGFGPDGLWDLCGYDWRSVEAVDAALVAWSSFIPRWLRGLGTADAFDALVARGLLDPIG